MIDTQPAKTGIFGEPQQVPGEFRGAHRQVSHQSDDKRISLSQIKNPLVVFHAGTGFHDNCTGYMVWLSERLKLFRQYGAIQKLVPLARPRRPIFTGGVEEVSVRVDDGIDRIRRGKAAHTGGRQCHGS